LPGSTGWRKLPLADYAALVAATDVRLPLQQSPAYGIAVAGSGAVPGYYLFETEGARAAAQVIRRRYAGLVTAHMAFRGPVWLDPASLEIRIAAAKAWSGLHRPWRWQFFLHMPEDTDAHSGHQVMRSAGRRRIMTGFATSWVDLTADIRGQLDGKWRNQLKKAEASGLAISVAGKRPASYSWLIDREGVQRSDRGYQALPATLIDAFRSASQSLHAHPGTLSVTAMAGRDKVAGALFLIHGHSATYHIGWSGDEGRSVNAQNLVLYAGAAALAERGIRHLDLGGINTGPLAGITRFKLGMGGDVTPLVGTYI